jgi:two-component system chemotaxis sensor kinase CheA
VDRIFDTEEIVVKPLGNLLKHLQHYVGATLMGDGRPALILDMTGLAKSAHLALKEETSFGAKAVVAEEQEGTDEQTLLVFTIHPDEQFAVPLSLVSRLEEVPANTIVDSLQGKVIPYRGRLLPLIMPEDVAPIGKPEASRENVTVVVFEIEREVGLVVTRIVDAVRTSVQLDTQSIAEKGFAGVALMQDKPTSFVDIYQLIEMAFPHWFQRQKLGTRRAVDPSEVTILLAEDSGFYRTVEKNYLVQEGFNVLDTEDGAAAFELLQKKAVDLVITDIEMPNMDGFELTRRIRATPELKGLPIIAVTSLSNEADRKTGEQAGVSAYLVKLQREQLLQEVMRLLSLPTGKPAQKVS